MKRVLLAVFACGILIAASAPVYAQTLAVDDPVLKAIWTEAMDNSQLKTLAHELLDGIGPRLTGSSQGEQAHEWAVAKFAEWGIPARNEQWGTWVGWDRGICHIDMVAPWVKTLDGNLLSWSPGTGRAVTAEAVFIPEIADAEAFQRWLPSARGKWVMISFPEPTGRPDAVWEANATPEVYEQMREERDAAEEAFNENLSNTGLNPRNELHQALADAGVAGIITLSWPNLWHVRRTFGAQTTPCSIGWRRVAVVRRSRSRPRRSSSARSPSSTPWP